MNLWKVISAALVLYLAGVGTGFFVANSRTKDRPAFYESPRASMRDIMQRMESRLELSDDQKEKVSAILRARREKMHALIDGVRPQIKAAEKTMREKIEALLSEEQRAKFEEVFSRRGRPGRSPKSMRGNGRREQGTHKRREEPDERDQPQNGDSDCPAAEVEEVSEAPTPSTND